LNLEIRSRTVPFNPPPYEATKQVGDKNVELPPGENTAFDAIKGDTIYASPEVPGSGSSTNEEAQL